MGFFPFLPQSVPAGGGSFTGSINTTGIVNTGTVSTTGLLTASAAATVGTTLSVGGILSQNAGSNSSGSAPLITPANANGTAAQLSDTTRDYMVYLSVGTAGTNLVIAIGPTSGVADQIYTASTAAAGELFCFRLPAGWFWKWTATTATLAEQTAIGC